MTQCIELDRPTITEQYLAGVSTQELATRHGAGKLTILRRLVAWGVPRRACGRTRPPGGPMFLASRGYWTTTDRDGRKCYIHRACWEACRGAIPEGFVVHHIDGDRQNNSIDNLACMTGSEHRAWHNKNSKEAK